ncbi:MAG: single-stranded DNA-binding protein [Desulfobacterales bacterium]|nr:single-stranded DNA-binding protein [Desulfobacterales bacterium]
MAGSLNKVMLIGRLGKDPEIRYTQEGRAVGNFSMATSQQWSDRDSGEKKERTDWHRVVIFGRLAEICSQYLSKGRLVYIEGRLQSRSYEQDGVTKYITEVVANDMQMLESKNAAQSQYADNSAPSYDAGATSQPQPQQPASSGGGGNEFDDDIPF